MQKNDFVISVNGLASGKNVIDLEADKEFFARFENTEVLDAALAVTLVIDKGHGKILFNCGIKGTLTVPCDRCLCPVTMPVDTRVCFKLSGESDGGGGISGGDGYEEVFLRDDSDCLDLSQEIYDYSLLALPLQRFHNEGECDKAALGYLSRDDGSPDDMPMDTPFASLAEMLNRKN